MSVDPSLGELIHATLADELLIESEGWAVDKVNRVRDRLKGLGGITRDYVVEVVWISHYTAFTAPGNHIYVSRRLLERCTSDDQIGFVIAHEAGHHELGHLDSLPSWMNEVIGKDAGLVLSALCRGLETLVIGPEREAEADEFALEACLKAGYEGPLSVSVFDILEQRALDRGDVDGVFGAVEPGELGEEGSVVDTLHRWMHQRLRGYYPIRDRRDALMAALPRIDAEVRKLLGMT